LARWQDGRRRLQGGGGGPFACASITLESVFGAPTYLVLSLRETQMLRLLEVHDGTYAIYFGEQELIAGLNYRQAVRFALRSHLLPQR
jgi:hypothetical protein